MNNSTTNTSADATDERDLSGDLVVGQACPRCRRINAVVYNGNYWCTRCPWVMSESGRPERIIVAYLIQRRAACLAQGDAKGVAHMDFYLKDHDGVVV